MMHVDAWWLASPMDAGGHMHRWTPPMDGAMEHVPQSDGAKFKLLSLSTFPIRSG